MTKKQTPSPNTVMMTPPMAGPTTRDMFMSDELRLTALARSSRPTISIMNVWRAGLSNRLTTPSRPASRYTCQSTTVSVTTRMPRTRASSPPADCVRYSRFRLLARSATRPPNGPNSSIGRNWSPTTMPRATPLSVRWRTSQAWATDCIQVPDTEMSWAQK